MMDYLIKLPPLFKHSNIMNLESLLNKIRYHYKEKTSVLVAIYIEALEQLFVESPS